MELRGPVCRSVVLTAMIAIGFCADAADSPPKSSAGRPYYTLCVSSIDSVVDGCKSVFDSINRPELADSLGERQTSYRQFAGIDRKKPAGMMSVWAEGKSSDIIFLPVQEIDELLKTATFEVVGFHQVSPNHYEIERPGSPYHVLVQNDYALLADSTDTIKSLQLTPERLTRSLRNRYDVSIHFDLKQIPQTVKSRYVEATRAETEPLLQPQDDEDAKAAALRKTIGKLGLDIFQRLSLDTSEITIGSRLDPETHQFMFELIVEASPKSPTANMLTQLASHRSDFTPLVAPDAPAGLALNLPLGGIVDQILGKPKNDATKGSRLDMGVQVATNPDGRLSLLMAARGDEAAELNNAVPGFIQSLEDSGQIDSVRENFDLHEGVVIHTLVPTQLPALITSYLGENLEVAVGQGDQIVWLAIGPPKSIVDQLLDAIDASLKPSDTDAPVPLVRGRFQAKKVPQLVGTDTLAPSLDTKTAQETFAKGGDRFSFLVEPVANGIKLRIDAEEGFVRLIGRNWAKQIDDLATEQPEK